MIGRPLVTITVAACTLLGSQAQAPSSPPVRAHHALVYDATEQVVLLAGGSTPQDGGQRSQFFSDLWALTDTGWQLRGDLVEQRSGFALAYNPDDRKVWSFGGFDGQALGDLRVLGHGSWVPSGKHPTLTAAEPGFVYDLGRHRFVLFGGSGRPGGRNDQTWEFDGTTWRLAVSEGNPPARQAHAMIYDSRRHVTLVFGGMVGGGGGGRPQALGDTWEYDGRKWVERKEAGPPARFGAGVTFDSRRGVVVLFGGLGAAGFLGDTWTWDGQRWQQVATTGPAPRGMGYLAYDARRDRVVLFGGRKGWPNGDLNDTWEWDGAKWRVWSVGDSAH